MTSLGLYYRTLRHTRASQLLWRARYLLERRRAGRRTAGPWRWNLDGPPRVREDLPFPPIPHLHTPETAAAGLHTGELCHLNKAVNLGREHLDWQLGTVAKDRLWVATLHYHEWAYRLVEAVVRDANAN